MHHRKFREPLSMSIEKRGGEHVKSLRATPDSGSESFFKDLRAWHVDNLRQDAKPLCSLLRRFDKRLRRCGISKDCDPLHVRYGLDQDFETLGTDLCIEERQPGEIAAGAEEFVTIPEASASPRAANTMGMLDVASAAARTGAVPAVTITSTLRRASSAARC